MQLCMYCSYCGQNCVFFFNVTWYCIDCHIHNSIVNTIILILISLKVLDFVGREFILYVWFVLNLWSMEIGFLPTPHAICFLGVCRHIKSCVGGDIGLIWSLYAHPNGHSSDKQTTMNEAVIKMQLGSKCLTFLFSTRQVESLSISFQSKPCTQGYYSLHDASNSVMGWKWTGKWRLLWWWTKNKFLAGAECPSYKHDIG